MQTPNSTTGPALRVEVDRDGIVREIATPDGEPLFGLGADALGRDLFRDLLPGANVPAFAGRFREAVRAGGLPPAFSFALGGEAGSVLLGVSWDWGHEAGRYGMTLEALTHAPPTRHREAMLAVDLRARAEAVDPSVCEAEPIHIPGSIQASAMLLAIDPVSGTIRAASENIADILGRDPSAVIGRTPEDVVLPALATRIADAVAAGATSVQPIRFELPLGAPAHPFSVALHRHDDQVIVEFEAAPVHPGDFGVPRHAEIRDAIRILRGQATLPSLATEAARLLRAITGYERLLVYRFDAQWNGEAIGEAICEDWPQSLLGLRFPASDIPRQARALYARSPSRYVIDRDVAATRLVASSDQNRPLDLSHAVHRSLSPVHLEYQRNLGVNGSMSSAIMVEGRLWGLVIGHHRRPHYVAPETREAVSSLVDVLALCIEEIGVETQARAQEAHLALQVALLAQMAGADEMEEALTQGAVRLTDLFGATGAALVTRDRIVPIGAAPPERLIAGLVGFLRADPEALAAGYETDHLASRCPVAEACQDVASGLLAVAIDPTAVRLILWFRPEVTQQIVWGGDPRKTVLADTRSAAILPRRSFERWVEEKRGISAPWAPWEIASARTLAGAVGSLTLRASRRVRELSAKQDELVEALRQKDKLLADKDLLTREIDHRVKNSLQIISAFIRLQSRQVADPEAREAFSDTFARVMSIARVHDSLYQSDDINEVDLGQTIETLCRDLGEMDGKGHQLTVTAERGLKVSYRTAVSLCLILTELVTNALKYAYPVDHSGPVEVSVARLNDGQQLRVSDQGAGLPAGWEASRRKGLGMKLIQAMLTQIDATMEVESTPGTCFTIRC